MHAKPNPSPAAAELRRRAEARLREQHPETSQARTEADTQRLVHELQVHQIELEMQNEELHQARAEMEVGLEKYSDLYDFAPVGYLTLDRAGTIREANLTSASLLGLERSRLVQRRFGLFLSAADLPVFTAFLKQTFEDKAKASCEVTLLREGKPAVEARLEATVAASGRECRVVVTDIAERNRAERDRLILSKLESTGILAGGIAHDFNNLLTVILLNLELAGYLAPAGGELRQALEEAKRAALASRSLTQQLITFAQGGAPVREPTCLSGVIQESIRPALSGSRVRGELALAEDLWPANVDAEQIGQVIRNLVQNAREAMPEGGVVSVRAENVVLGADGNPSLPAGSYVRLNVTDRGGGIAPDVLPKIFDPYFSTKQRGNQKGMGLGLTICHAVVQKHGGAITVQTEAGMGTAFEVLLPASPQSPREQKQAKPQPPPRPARILVMEDETEVRTAVGLALRRLGHEAELVTDGQRAVEVYAKANSEGRPFDAVILDLTIRGAMGGSEAIQALRKLDPAVKAIVMSGHSTAPELLDPGRYGFKGALGKPFESDQLRDMLSRVMDRCP